MSSHLYDRTPETRDRMLAQLLGHSIAGLFWLFVVLMTRSIF